MEKYRQATLLDFFEICRQLEYGWVDHSGVKHHGANNSPEYFLQTPEEVLNSEIGICWDQTELQRAWFIEHGYEVQTFLLFYELNENCWPSHSVLVYREGSKYCWFEPMFNGDNVYYSGIHKYDSLETLLAKLKVKFIANAKDLNMLPDEICLDKFSIYEYDRPTFGIDDCEFFRHCLRGRKINL